MLRKCFFCGETNEIVLEEHLGVIINGFETTKLLEELERNGVIYEPRKDYFKSIDYLGRNSVCRGQT